MRLLLDTHVLLWAAAGDVQLTPDRRRLIKEADEVFVSAATIWGIAIKRALGKLVVDGDPRQVARANGCLPLPITWDHGAAVEALPMHHGDPFDRLLIAQARVEGLTLMTDDRDILRYDVAVL